MYLQTKQALYLNNKVVLEIPSNIIALLSQGPHVVLVLLQVSGEGLEQQLPQPRQEDAPQLLGSLLLTIRLQHNDSVNTQ